MRRPTLAMILKAAAWGSEWRASASEVRTTAAYYEGRAEGLRLALKLLREMPQHPIVRLEKP